MIRVRLPSQLRILASIDDELELPSTCIKTVLDVLVQLETLYPTLDGTLWNKKLMARRPYVRIFACQEDLSTFPLDYVLPKDVLNGDEPIVFIGAIAGG